MGFLDTIRNLTRPYDDDDDEYFDDDQPPAQRAAPQREPERQPPQNRQGSFSSQYEQTRRSAARDDKVVNIGSPPGMKVVLVKPERFEQAAEIADHLREKHSVVMNLEQTHKDVARRLIDFLSGVAYAQDGKIKKVANSTYIITPYNVDLMGDLMDELESGGSMYF
jgi:cell division inhibitor SepF